MLAETVDANICCILYRHIVRMDHDTIVNKVIDADSMMNDERKQGRSRKYWTEKIEKIGYKRGKKLVEMRTLALDRKAWRLWLE